MAKTTNELDGIIDGIDGKKILGELKTLIERTEIDLEKATNKFISAVKSPYAKAALKTSDEKYNHGIVAVKGLSTATRSFKSKPTMVISVVMKNCSAMEQNSCNVSEETRDYDKRQKIGIAGSWRKCLACERIWDTADTENGDNCPSCSGTNSVILSGQRVPTRTIAILNRKDMRTGDISVFNTKICEVFLFNGDTYEEAFIKFTGKQRELLKKVRFGIPFDINVDAKPFTNTTTGQKWYSTTGTSQIKPCSVDGFKDILEIFEDLSESIVKSLNDADDKEFVNLFLMIVDEPTKPKDKWLVNLCDPESDESESQIITMYIEDEHIAKQLIADDVGIFVGRYSETTRTNDGVEETSRVLNVNAEIMGVPVYIMDENGTKLISA